ncbi:peptidylprolyl isomerase [Lederbergia sp. NSJ-179]|uniref:peptidylprolyl isomerase n=1 Tax=Lederbergia sp. NSJ-179 TaxID=2931402 RepID=UPI001FD5AC02|nr:peptidylprolyl isomerase [Lederbergia sp. NSJ-179]MCJ7842593.1 peptidylprolyl isomerase [Lederbergia sp. NSJ-179]
MSQNQQSITSSKKFTISVIVLILIGAAAIFTAAFVKREIVANVGDVKITKDELQDELVENYGDQTLDAMINDKIVDMEIKKAKVSVSDKDIKKEMDQYIEQSGGEEAFNSALQQQGLKKKDVEKNIVKMLSIKKILEPRIEIKDEEIKDYFEQNKASFDQEEQVEASHILVDDEKTAKEVKKKLDEGEDFATLAKEYSKDKANAESGGELGFFGKGKMEKEFEDKAFSTKVGDISDPVKTKHGYHIIKVTDKKEAKKAKLEDHKDEIKDTLFDQKLQTEYQTWLNEKKEDYKIKKSLGQK